MKKLFLINLLFIILLISCKQENNEFGFPEKPVKIIVYTGPGGLIDITARKFTDIANKYTDATFVVENKSGAGGIVAIKRLLQLPADGYTILACTKSNISKIVSSGGEVYIDAIDWAALMMADPECVITNLQQKNFLWEDVVKDAEEKNGHQLWLGPANGGLDHVTALKIWENFDIKAKWIPFKSGGKARSALLGKQGIAYVGNPGEVLGNPDLNVAVISSQERLAKFPNTPVFRDFGITELDNEYMWRGFVFRKGIPDKIKKWYDHLFQNVTNDPEWREFWEKSGIDVVYYDSEKFTEIVQQDLQDFTHYLGKIGIIQAENENILAKLASGKPLQFLLLTVLLILLAVAFLLFFSKKKDYLGQIMIPLFFIFLAFIFFLLTFAFPTNDEVGPSVVPRLWIFLLIPLNLYLLIDVLKKKEKMIQNGDKNTVFKFVLLLVLYLFSIFYLGYFLSSFLFVFLGIYLLGYRKYLPIILISCGWVLFSYFIFYRILFVPFPVGKLIEVVF